MSVVPFMEMETLEGKKVSLGLQWQQNQAFVLDMMNLGSLFDMSECSVPVPVAVSRVQQSD